jgi:TRAP-type C4-dicarboxylate transport system permease small subunit
MADRAGLGFVGFILGGITAAVMLVAFAVVIGHVDGRFVLDSPTQIAANQ